MITYVVGDLFTSPAKVLTNTVNTVGVMGKGIAKEFKKIYPEMFDRYRDLCENNEFDVGKLWLYKTKNKWILNFPTKKHWRSPSTPKYVELGLKRFVEVYAKLGIHSIAFPALGCGNGELDFETQVKPIMEKYLQQLPVNVFIYTGRKDPFPPEHKTPKEIKKWLRSEPETLSFKEVWSDLRIILANEPTFNTFKTNALFKARLENDSKRVVIEAGERTYPVPYEKLLDFWQQLRRYGFSLRRIAPNGLERSTSYLVPIFAKLDYVKPVIMTDNYESIESNPSIGLQFLAPSLNSTRKQERLF